MANAQLKAQVVEFRQQKQLSELHDCAVSDFDLARTVEGAKPDDDAGFGATSLLALAEHVVPARRLICRERDSLDAIPFICRGWAACSVTLSDGRRQILSFLLPGDMAPTSLVFDPATQFSIEAVTDVHYRTIKRADFRTVLLRNADLFDKFSRIWVEEKARADQLAIDLGRRSADERIARLVLNLAERLSRRGLANGDTFEFPLRQHHIADATGLTAVHVSKVLSEFRRAGMIVIRDRSLTISNPAALRAVANMR